MEIELTFPLASLEAIVDRVRSQLELPEFSRVRLAVFDHVPSNYGFVMPIKELVRVCHAHSIPVLVDGAHALGGLDLDVTDLGADFYVSNAHKWLCSPKGAAFLYVKPKYQATIRPMAISHGFGSGFCSEFVWTGLRDYGPYLALHTVLHFWETFGAHKIRTYMHGLCKTAAEHLVGEFSRRRLS